MPPPYLSVPVTHCRLPIHAAGLRLRYLEWGSGGRDVVLLLHDCGEAADVWRTIGPRLADRGYRVIAPDLRGESCHDALDGRPSTCFESVRQHRLCRHSEVAHPGVLSIAPPIMLHHQATGSRAARWTAGMAQPAWRKTSRRSLWRW